MYEVKNIQNPESGPVPKQNNNFLAISIIVAAVFISGTIVYAVSVLKPGTQIAGINPPAAQPPSVNAAEVMKLSDKDVVLGDPNAPVTLVEYGDYQCPFCGRMFSEVEPLLRKNYIETGKLKMVFRNLQFLGVESTNAGAAALCANDQSKFWAYHDEIYKAEIVDGSENNGNLNRSLFLSLAGKAGLDINAFTACIDSSKYVADVQAETRAANVFGINSTPSNFINGTQVQGAQPYDAFKVVIDAALNK
jgi:protein-disulfide isomerase